MGFDWFSCSSIGAGSRDEGRRGSEGTRGFFSVAKAIDETPSGREQGGIGALGNYLDPGILNTSGFLHTSMEFQKLGMPQWTTRNATARNGVGVHVSFHTFFPVLFTSATSVASEILRWRFCSFDLISVCTLLLHLPAFHGSTVGGPM